MLRRIEEVLDLVELKAQARVAYRKYSLGMKQRLGIAAALLTDPELVLLDEPTNGLDPAGMYEIRQLIQRLAALGKTIFISSHLLNEVQQVCNRVAILQKGNLIEQGDVRELLRGKEQVLVRLREAGELQRARLLLEQARSRGADWIGSVHTEKDRQGQETLRIDAPKTYSAEVNRLLGQNEIFAAELHPYEGSLEEVYLQLTTPDVVSGEHLGMAALAGGSEILEWYDHQDEVNGNVVGVPGKGKGGESEHGIRDGGRRPGAARMLVEHAAPLATRVGTVILGRMDFTSVLLRLIGMELYKIRRRPMSKVLCTLAVTLALLVPLAIGVELAINVNTSASNFAPSCAAPASTGGPVGPGCVPLSFAAMQTLKQGVLTGLSAPLRLPSSLELAVTQNELNPAIILIIILVGSIAGGEMSTGTVRLMFTRGPWRGQFLLARYGAAFVCTAIGVPGMAIAGVVVAQLFNLLSGVPQGTAFFGAGWFGHALLYLLATMLNWFMYAVVAIFFSVLGRSTVAGVVGALTWFFAEPIVSGILTVAGNFSVGLAGTFLRALPDYLMGNNARALQLNQAQYLFGSTGSSESNLQALITLTIYLAAFIGLTWWLNESRDVTN